MSLQFLCQGKKVDGRSKCKARAKELFQWKYCRASHIPLTARGSLMRLKKQYRCRQVGTYFHTDVHDEVYSIRRQCGNDAEPQRDYCIYHPDEANKDQDQQMRIIRQLEFQELQQSFQEMTIREKQVEELAKREQNHLMVMREIEKLFYEHSIRVFPTIKKKIGVDRSHGRIC